MIGPGGGRWWSYPLVDLFSFMRTSLTSVPDGPRRVHSTSPPPAARRGTCLGEVDTVMDHDRILGTPLASCVRASVGACGCRPPAQSSTPPPPGPPRGLDKVGGQHPPPIPPSLPLQTPFTLAHTSDGYWFRCLSLTNIVHIIRHHHTS